MTTFSTTPHEHVDDISHTDLREAAIAGVISDAVCAEADPFGPYGASEDEVCRRWITPHGTTMQTYRIEADDLAGFGEAVVIADQGAYRIGIAWGADASWGDLHNCPGDNSDPAFEAAVNAAINDYLNDWTAWSARN